MSKSLAGYTRSGTDPDQLLAQIRKCRAQLGRTPTLPEFVTFCGTQKYKHRIFTVYGSWVKALSLCGMLPPPKNNRGSVQVYYKTELTRRMYNYAKESGRIPTGEDCTPRGKLPSYATYTLHFGSFERARQVAGVYELGLPPLRS